MIEVFTTNFQDNTQVKRVLNLFENDFPELKFNVDLSESAADYPCGHSILRVEGAAIQSNQIISAVNKLGFKCAILEDKICANTNTDKPEFWETNFLEKQEMWGFEPAHSAVLARDLFMETAVKNVLIPGIGYGRNAHIFRDAGMTVTGIEISKTAIELAKKNYGTGIIIHHGSVTDMPFDTNQYDGIFCYALIHLLDIDEREKLIQDCYRQLSDKGLMIFAVISKEAKTYGQGTFLSKDRFELFGGVKMFFYDKDSIQTEFGGVGLLEITAVQENYPFFLIKCRKGEE